MKRFDLPNDISVMHESNEGYWVKHSDALAVEEHLSNRLKEMYRLREDSRVLAASVCNKNDSLRDDLERFRRIASASMAVAILSVGWIVLHFASQLTN